MMWSDVLDSDIQAIFDHEHYSDYAHKPAPQLAAHFYIDGGAPFDPNSGASFEASLDVQQELTATGAKVYLYDIPSPTDGAVMAGWTDVIEQNLVDLLSNSFGQCELDYFPEYNGGQDYRGILKAQHELFLQANSQGITFLVSSGDSAGRQCPEAGYFSGVHNHKFATFVPSVSTPASDPNVTSVGGTNLVTTHVAGGLESKYVAENGWADPEVPYDPFTGVTAPNCDQDPGPGCVKDGFWGPGGGYSSMWPAPAYQGMVQTGSGMRALPDIGMQVGGCPLGLSNPPCNGGNLPYNGNGNSHRSAAVVAWGVGQGGGFFGVIGTSVSSPEFASVVAMLVEQNGRQGDLNTGYIYPMAVSNGTFNHAYRTGIPGWNGVQNTQVSPNYSLTTGVGTPRVTNFIGQPGAPTAGNPQTHSNP
jgi:hypothetical protein